MLLLSVLVVPVCVLPSVWRKPGSTLPVSRSSSLQDLTLLPLRVVSTLLWESMSMNNGVVLGWLR
jgi:hypothetical protein